MSSFSGKLVARYTLVDIFKLMTEGPKPIVGKINGLDLSSTRFCYMRLLKPPAKLLPFMHQATAWVVALGLLLRVISLS